MSRPRRRSRAVRFTVKGKRTGVARQKKKVTADSPMAIEKIFRLQQLASQLQFRKLSERQEMALQFLEFQDENELTERDLQFIHSYVYPPEEFEEDDSYDQLEDNQFLTPDVDFNEPNDEPIDFDDQFDQVNIFFKDLSEVKSLCHYTIIYGAVVIFTF